MPDTVHLLINTASRKGRESLESIRQALEAERLTPDVIHDLAKTDIAQVIKSVRTAKPSLLIIAGGDGTVSSTLGYIAGTGIPVGIIPLGTTNNFARSLRLPLTIPEAVATIQKSSTKHVDLGILNDQYFANVVGIGLSGDIAASASDGHKKILGRLAYALTGLKQLFRHESFVVKVTDPATKLVASYETHQLIVANGRYHAGKQIAEDAEVDNRELIVFPLGNRHRLSLIWHTLDFYTGPRKKIIHGPYLTGKDIRLSLSKRQQLEIDGEPQTITGDITLRVAPKAVQVRY